MQHYVHCIILRLLVGFAFLLMTINGQSQSQDSVYFWEQYVEGRSKCKASEFYNAKVLLENTLSEVRESDYKDFDLEARILTDIAWAYAGLRDNVSENMYIDAAMDIYANNLNLESEEYAAVLHDMALTQGERGKYQYAKELLDSSNVIFQKYIPDLYPAGLASNLVALGWIYRAQGQYDEAITALKKAIAQIKTKNGDHYTDLGTANHILGYTLMYHGKSDEALPYLHEGKRLRAQSHGLTHPFYLQSLQKISECYTYLQLYDDAQLYLDIIIETIHISNQQDSNEIQLDSIKSWYTLLQTYVSKGNIYLYRYSTSQDPEDLKSNLIWYTKSIDIIQKILLYYPSKEGRFQLLNEYTSLFDNCVNQAMLLYDFNQEPHYLEQAFKVSELSRGFSFLESLHKAQSTTNYNVPKDLLERESELTIKMQKFEMENEDSFVNSNDWIPLNLELQKVQQLIKKEYPNYFDLQSNLIVPTLADIQHQLNDSTAIVEYYEGYQKVFVFVITKDTSYSKTVPINQKYDQVMTRLISNASKNPISNTYPLKALKQDAMQIHQWLIQPIDSLIDSKTKLVFIPHKKQNYLPFELLMESDSTLTDPNYLLEHYSISYDYSCATLLAERTFNEQGLYPYHGFAPGIHNESLPDESVNEVKESKNILGGRYSLNQSANRSKFFNGLQNANVVHLAAHSILDTSDISKFAIVLNDPKSKAQKDSVWIEDIYLSTIKAELIILSGCQTADGVLKEGEGLLSLTNAFKYAGAKSLTCSLWETENKVGSQIIVKYIKNLKNGQSKDEALRNAKLDFLKSADPLLQHPFYWSTFINVGDQKAILSELTKPSNSYSQYIIAFSFLLGMLGFLFIKNKKSKNLG